MSEIATDRMRKVKSILVTQEAPADANSPYLKLAEKFNLKIDFRPFIQVEPVPVKEFRKQKIDILNHTAIIFTSRNAVDHFFHICQELKVEMPPEMKYKNNSTVSVPKTTSRSLTQLKMWIPAISVRPNIMARQYTNTTFKKTMVRIMALSFIHKNMAPPKVSA